MNLAGLLPETSIHFLSKPEAYESLKQHTNQDFGMDVLKWEEWGLANDYLGANWRGLSDLLDKQADSE